MENLEFQTLGPYELQKELGRGATGTVYLARDGRGDRQVAVKVAHARAEEPVKTAERRRRLFLNEARASSLLKHRNIVEVYDVGEEDGIVYLAMEYVPGARTLDEFCTPERLLPVEDVVDIVIKCASALDYAHRRGVVHRDVKPRNILLTDDRAVKVGDFGIALVTGADAAETLDQSQPGSPLYLSPEQILGEPVTAASDIFALGVVLYELLAGRHPFVADLIPAISHNITRKPHAPLTSVRPDLPPALSRIVDRTLKKHPAGRYRSALDLAGDLGLVFDNVNLSEADLSSSEQFERIKDLAFFASFPENEIWEVLNASHWQELESATEIIHEGEFGDSFHILVEGEVAVRKGGTEVDVLRKGSCFGEIGFVTRKKRMASIVARTPVTVMEIRAALIDRISVGCQLRFHKAFIDTMAERLLRAMEINSKAMAKRPGAGAGGERRGS